MKQTAVELLEKELKERYPLINSEPLFEHAKEMEKEQITDAYDDGWYDGEAGMKKAYYQYYNETYKSE